MTDLVYLLCSLPSLSFAQSPPISLDEFHLEAKRIISSRQYKKLELADIRKIKGKTKNGDVKGIAGMLSVLQKDLAEMRQARNQNRNPELDAMDRSLMNKNPLEKEIEIMRWQWEELNSIEFGKAFTMTELMVYKLKLQILCRKNSFNAERGLQVLDSVVNPANQEK